MTRFSRALAVSLLLITLLSWGALPAAAQSVQSIVDQMNAQYEQQLESVDNYVIETTLYTSYHRKVMDDGQPTYETTTRMNGNSQILDAMDTTPTTTSSGPAFLERLPQHATYDGTETIDGVRSHVLRIDDPSALIDDMDEGAEDMTYYVDAEMYVPTRMTMTMAPPSENANAPTMTIDFQDYRTEDGLTIPYRMTMTMDAGLSEDEQRQMEKMRQKLEQLPEEQREQMKRMMGDRFEEMQNMMTGKPTTVEVTSVRVNEGIPDGIFDDVDDEQ